MTIRTALAPMLIARDRFGAFRFVFFVYRIHGQLSTSRATRLKRFLSSRQRFRFQEFLNPPIVAKCED